jgi:transposase InsO family protein
MAKRSIYSLNILFAGEGGDERIDEAIDFLTNDRVPPGQSPAKMARKYAGFRAENGRLWYGTREVIRSADRADIIKQAYENDVRVHGKGVVLLYKLFSEHYLNITRQHIKDFLETNSAYNLGKQVEHRVNKPIISSHPNSLWGIDLIDCEMYKGSNYGWRYIVTVVDVFSRYTWLGKLKDREASSIATVFSDICNRAGITPDSLLSDNGTEFMAEFDERLKELDIVHRRTRSHMPQANGIVERKNQEVRKIMRSIMLSNGTKVWYRHLDDVEKALNSSYVSTIKATPEAVWVANKNKLSRRNLPANIIQGNPRLEARLAVREKAEKDIDKFREYDYEEGNHVRVKMATIFSQVRALVKANRTKEIICTYSPDVFRVEKVVRVHATTLERRRYVVRNLRTGNVLFNSKGTGAFQCYSSYLTPADKNDEADISMEDGLRLNGCQKTKTDLIY